MNSKDKDLKKLTFDERLEITRKIVKSVKSLEENYGMFPEDPFK